MIHRGIYQCLFFLALSIAVCLNGLSQKPIKNFIDSMSKTAYIINNGDSVAVHIDSTVIMNKITFHLYQSYYDKGRSANSSYKRVLNSYEDIIKKQDSILVEKEAYYRQLNASFQSLSGNTMNFIDSTRTGLQSISMSLNNAETHLNTTQQLLTDTQKLLIKEKRSRNSRAWKFGFGGIVIGGLLGAIIIH